MIIMTDILEVTILIFGFLYWPLLYVRLRDVICGYTLTKRKIAVAAIFAVAATLLLVIFNPKIYNYQDPYTFLIPLIAITPVVILAIGKANVRRTNIKIVVLAAYLHVFWQAFPEIKTVFIFTDLVGIAVVLVIIRLHKSMKIGEQKHLIDMTKIKSRSTILAKTKTILHNIKLNRKKKQEGNKKSEKKESKKEEKSTNKPISLKELWSN